MAYTESGNYIYCQAGWSCSHLLEDHATGSEDLFAFIFWVFFVLVPYVLLFVRVALRFAEAVAAAIQELEKRKNPLFGKVAFRLVGLLLCLYVGDMVLKFLLSPLLEWGTVGTILNYAFWGVVTLQTVLVLMLLVGVVLVSGVHLAALVACGVWFKRPKIRKAPFA